jgi:hypothetical protein
MVKEARVITAKHYYLIGTLPEKIYWLLPYIPRVGSKK